MSYREHLPHPALRPYVDRFWTRVWQPSSALAAASPARGEHASPAAWILPDGCIDILLNLTSGRAVAVGTMTRTLVIPPGPASTIVAVRFRPGGARPFLRLAAHALTDTQIPCADLDLRDLIPPGFGDRDPRDGRAVMTTLQALERLLLRRLRDLPGPDPLIDHAIRLLLGPTPPSVESVARRVGWSRQHLRRAFAAHVGIGPKHFDRVARLQRTVALLQGQPRRGLADVAASAGYFDQAHMSADFRALVGATPQAVRGQAGSIFPIQSLLDEG
jgi:AraC-like DNA-binding protein